MGEAASDNSGAEAAYRRLYAYHPQVLAYCARRVGHEDAADVAAEVFAVAWRRIADVPAGEAALPWLYGVAYRTVSHHWRGASRRSRLLRKAAGHAPEVQVGPEAQLVQRAEYDLVLDALANLRDKDQEVLLLVVWEEMSHDQIATILGSSSAAARQRFRRAKKALLREYVRLGGTVPIPAVAQEGGEL